MQLTLFNTLDELLDSMVEVFLSHNGELPMDWTPKRQTALFNLSVEYPEAIFELCNRLEYEDVKKIELNATQYMKSAYKLQIMTKALSYDINRVADAFLFLCNCSVVARKKFVERTKSELAFLKLETISCDNERKQIGYLNAALRAYSEALYCDDHTIGGEIVGPIETKEGYLMVRDYWRLDPQEVYEEFKDFPYKSIKTYCIYENSDIFVDMNGNLKGNSNISQGLKKYCVVITNKEGAYYTLERGEIDHVTENLEQWLIKMMKAYKIKSYEDKCKMLIFNEYYALKPIFEYVGIEWKSYSRKNCDISASEEYVEINKRNRKKLFELNDEQAIKKYARTMLDPRVKWR